MTREEVIDYFKRSVAEGNTDDERQHNEVIDMAIKVLEQEPCNKTQMIDKSNFSQEQYLADIQSAYDCGKSAIYKIREEINNLTVYYTTKAKGIGLISQREVNRVFDKYRK